MESAIRKSGSHVSREGKRTEAGQGSSVPHFAIIGGVGLHGSIRASGAKNAALPIMAAAILADEPVRLTNVPQLADVRTQAQLLRCLGLRVTRENGATTAEGNEQSGADIPVCRGSGNSAEPPRADKNVCPTDTGGSASLGLLIETVDPSPVRAREGLVRRMRAGFCVLGPLLARRGRAVVPLPGGCNIGNRPVDLHLRGLAALGADIRLERGYVVASARRLAGANIELLGPNGPTLTGTANVMSAAVLAHGTTTIHGAAAEPEVVDLGQFLIALGAKIEGLGTSTIRIAGVEQLGGASHRLIPDRIETGTLLMAAAITGGSATVVGAVPEHLTAVLAKLRESGAEVEVGQDSVSIAAPGRLRAVNIIAEPYPGVPTDLQAQWTALAAVSEGTSRVEDRVFPGRFLHVAELNRLGAYIVGAHGVASIEGVRRLNGARVTACDLRASAALVLAGLSAHGATIVEHIHHLDRGYQRLDDKLRQLGARIERVIQSTSDQPRVAVTS
jgi:UDP-N-acetylglucosamine 1-carboxyvinyltransferase